MLGRQEVGDIDEARQPARNHHIEQPAQVQTGVERVPPGQDARRGVAAAVPFTRPKHVGVAGENECLAAGFGGATDEIIADAAVAQHVQLHPDAPAARLRGLDGTHVADGAEREGDAGAGGGACELQIAVMAQHAIQPGRSDHQRQWLLDPEQPRAQLAVLGVDQGARHEVPVVEGEAIAFEREFVLGTALDILERERRDAALGHPAQLLDVQGASEIPPRVVATQGHGHLSS